MASNTITVPLAERQLGKPNDVQPFLNKEAIPLLRQVRSTLNFTQKIRATGNTAGHPSAWVTIWESDRVPTDRVGLVEIFIVGHDAVPNAYGARKSILYVSDGDILAGTAMTVIYEYVTAPPLDSRIHIDTPNHVIQIQVMDTGVVEAHFLAIIEILEFT